MWRLHSAVAVGMASFIDPKRDQHLPGNVLLAGFGRIMKVVLEVSRQSRRAARKNRLGKRFGFLANGRGSRSGCSSYILSLNG